MTVMSEQSAVFDSRLGISGRGVYLLPFGILASFLSFLIAFRGMLNPELLTFGSIKLFFIWFLLILATGFFFMLFVGGCRILLQARHIAQRIEGFANIRLKPFIGNTVNIAPQEVMDIALVAPHRPYIPMTLLSRYRKNWKITLQDNSQYFINGELLGLDQYMAHLNRK